MKRNILLIKVLILSTTLFLQAQSVMEIETSNGNKANLKFDDGTFDTNGYQISWNSATNNLEFNGYALEFNGQFLLPVSKTRMTLSSLGNLGIGTTDPQQLFHVANPNGNARMRLQGDDGNLALDFYDYIIDLNFQQQSQYRGGVGMDTDANRLFMYHEGNGLFVQNGKLIVPSLSGGGPVYAEADGTLTVDDGNLTHTLHYSDFIPSQDDDDYGYMDVYDHGEIRFVMNEGATGDDDGKIDAPIRLPIGATITGYKVYYINESDDFFLARIYREPKEGHFDEDNINVDLLSSLALEEGGWYDNDNNLGGDLRIVSAEKTGIGITINSTSLFVFRLFCGNCSEQKIRAVDIFYEF